MPYVVIKSYRLRKRHLAALVAAFLLLAALPLMARPAARFAGREGSARPAAALAGHTVVVDAGHGGIDPGVVGAAGTLEKDVNLEVARLLAGYLRAAGVNVVMTREADTDLSDPATAGAVAKKREDLQCRVALANDSGAALYVSVHANSFTDPARRGARAFYQRGSAEGQRVAASIQEELIRTVRGSDKSPAEADYYVTRNTAMPAVVVEVGYLTNLDEEKLLGDPAYREKVARAVSAGVLKYLAQSAAAGRPDSAAGGSGAPGTGTAPEGAVGAFKKHSPAPELKP